MKNINAYTLADYILGQYPNKNITPMKLQKLAYYCKVWTLVAGEDMVAAAFVKWDYGPVNIELFKRYQHYGTDAIPCDKDSAHGIPAQQKALLEFILDNYVNFTAFALSNMTHKEDPWIMTAQNEVLSEDLIVEYYSKIPFAKNFSNASYADGPFYLLKSDNWHAFTLDMSQDEAASFESYPSYEEYLKLNKKAEEESIDFFHQVFN
jgi:uncharacterized phage-associated protein